MIGDLLVVTMFLFAVIIVGATVRYLQMKILELE